MTSVRLSIYSLVIGLTLTCSIGVANAQLINASPQALTFVYQNGGPAPGGQSIFLSASVPTPFTVTVSGTPWLNISPTTGTTSSTLYATVTPPANAAPGTMSGSIIIGPPATTDAIRTVVAVSLQILAPPQGTLSLSPNSLSFDYAVGSPAPPSMSVAVISSGSPAAFTVATSAPWITASGSSNVTPATVYVSVIPTSAMGPGTYTGAVSVNPSYAGGVAKQIAVTLRVYSGGNLVVAPNFITFNYSPGGPLPTGQAVTVVNSNGGAIPYSVSAATSGAGNWLSASPASAVTPGTVLVSVSPIGLAGGTYYGTVTFNSNTAGVVATQIPVTLTITNYSQLVASPASLAFQYQAGGAIPATQYVSVTSTGPAVSYTVAAQGPAWVTASINSGITPGGFGVNVHPPTTIPPGVYSASVILAPTSGGGTPITIPVSIQVTAANYLTVAYNNVSFSYTTGGVNPAPVIVPVTSSSGPLRFEAAAATLGSMNWLSVHPSSAYTPANLSISVAPQNLGPGTYSGTVVVNSDEAVNGQQSISVTLTVTASTSFLASPFGLMFSYQLNLGAPAPQIFAVKSQGSQAAFTVTTSTTTGGAWLTAIGGGTTPATVAVSVTVGALGPGTYNGRIQIIPADSSIPALQVPVVLNVSPAPVFLPAANQVDFQYQTNGPPPPQQRLTINANNNASVVFYPTTITADGGPWLSVTPDISVTPSDIVVSVNPSGLTPGLYYGLIAINNPDGITPASLVPVTLQVTDTQVLTVNTTAIVFRTGGGAPAPQQIPVNATSVTSYHATTFGGTWLQVSPTDGFTNGILTVTAIPDGLPSGYYLGGVSVEIPGVQNSQQVVPVALIIP